VKRVAEMDLPELEAAHLEAVEWARWYADDQNWTMTEQWHLRAVDLEEAMQRRALQ